MRCLPLGRTWRLLSVFRGPTQSEKRSRSGEERRLSDTAPRPLRKSAIFFEHFDEGGKKDVPYALPDGQRYRVVELPHVPFLPSLATLQRQREGGRGGGVGNGRTR